VEILSGVPEAKEDGSLVVRTKVIICIPRVKAYLLG
jgi:hypothetical protein